MTSPSSDRPAAPSVVVTVAIGTRALGALAGVVRAAKRADPLAPVTVIVPSSHVGVSVRRHLARFPGPDGRAGLVNVQWRGLGDVAAQLAGGELVRRATPLLSPPVRRAAIRAALDEAPGRFAAVAGNPATERSLDATFAELRALDVSDLALLQRSGPRARDVVELFERVRLRASPFADERDLLDLAIAAVDAGRDPLVRGALRSLGHLVVYLPNTLGPAEVRLLSALARRDPVTVIVGTTGDPAADRATDQLRAALVNGMRAIDTPLALTEPAAGTATELVRAPDPDEEVRLAVRRVVRALEDGILPEDIAIVTRVAQPYDTLLHERLQAAGIAHHAPSSSTLAQTVAGRALVGFLSVAARGFRRAELFRWVRGAPIRLADRRRVPRSFDRLARRAGIAGGLDQWHQRLDHLDEDFAQRPDRHEYDRRDLADLRAFIDELAGLAEAPPGGRWVDHTSWGIAVLERLVGSRVSIASGGHPWPLAEQEAFDAVVRVIETLGGLDAIEPDVDAERFLRVLGDELDAPVRASGTFGHGVFIGRVDDLAGARHDLLIVLGMAEGWFPPRGRSDPILPDAERRLLDGRLPARRRAPDDEQRAFLSTMAAAPVRVLSFPRVDSRNQRELLPAHAFLREVRRATGVAVRADGLDELVRATAAARPTVDGDGVAQSVGSLADTPSFLAGVLGARQPVDEHEHTMAGLLAGAPAPPELRRGIEAVTARAEGTFSEWTGWAGPDHAPRFVGDRVGSSTSFEQWANCPFRYYLGHVLAVRPLDEYADAESISRLDRGSLVHAVMERFIAEHLDDEPGRNWTPDDHRRMGELVDELAGEYEQQGRTGRPLLWQVELDRLERLLTAILEADQAMRVKAGVHPMDVELAFGYGDDAPPPVVFELGSGRRVAFHGSIDRVDRDPESGGLVVLDYKTGKDDGYDGLAEDITARGRHLQLVIYSEAARAQYGGEQVEAYYWFVEKFRSTRRLGGRIGPEQRQRFLDVLEVIVDGIEGGRFPANPGESNYWGFSHCGFCEFDRVCPSSRDDLWEGVRLSGAIADYVELAEPEPTSVAEAASGPARGPR